MLDRVNVYIVYLLLSLSAVELVIVRIGVAMTGNVVTGLSKNECECTQEPPLSKKEKAGG